MLLFLFEVKGQAQVEVPFLCLRPMSFILPPVDQLSASEDEQEEQEARFLAEQVSILCWVNPTTGYSTQAAQCSSTPVAAQG